MNLDNDPGIVSRNTTNDKVQSNYRIITKNKSENAIKFKAGNNLEKGGVISMMISLMLLLLLLLFLLLMWMIHWILFEITKPNLLQIHETLDVDDNDPGSDPVAVHMNKSADIVQSGDETIDNLFINVISVFLCDCLLSQIVKDVSSSENCNIWYQIQMRTNLCLSLHLLSVFFKQKYV